MAYQELGVPVEVPEEQPRKKAKGRPPRVGHFHPKAGPSHFVKVLVAPGLGYLPIPKAFKPYLGTIPSKIFLKTTTGCVWEVNVKDVNGKAVIEAGWPQFAIAHDLKLGYFLCFKKISDKDYRVIIFDYSCCEVVKRCPKHADEFARTVDVDDD